MKRFFPILLLCVLFLNACTPGIIVEEQKLDFLGFEGIPWNATPDEVVSSMGFSEDSCTTAEEDCGTYLRYTIRTDDCRLWEEDAISMRFSFVSWDVTTPHYGLDSIQIFFPDDANCERIEERLEQTYGIPADSYTTYYWSLDGIEEMTETCSQTQSAWSSEESLAVVLTDAVTDNFHDDVCLRQENPFSEQDFESFLKNHAATLIWTKDAFENLESPPNGMTRNFLEYDASILVMLLQRYSDTNG